MHRFAAIPVILALVVAACAPVPPVGLAPVRTPSEGAIEERIEAILARPELAPTNVGFAVWSLDRNAWLVERNADKLFVPASTAKLLLAVATLHTFGPAAAFRTLLLADREGSSARDDSVLAGNLYLVGGGNPDLSTGDLMDLAERLRAIGIRRVQGNLVLDATHFDSTAFGPGWMWDETAYPYGARVNAFMLNGNTVRITIRPGKTVGDTVRVAVSPRSAGLPFAVNATTRSDTTGGPPLWVTRAGDLPVTVVSGSMLIGSNPVVVTRTVPDAAAYAGSVFLDALASVGISVEGDLAFGVAPEDSAQVVAVASSAPTDLLVRRLLKESDNLVAETLVKQLGRRVNGEGSWPAGLSAVRRSLAAFAGLDSTAYCLADGSGLSRYTQVSPRMIVRVIARACDEFTVAPEFLSALAIAGVDGTLARRLTDGDVAGYVRGKTGSMSSISSLSGVLVTQAGERLTFSLIMNGFVGSSAQVRRAQDDLVRLLRRYPPPRKPSSR